MKSALDIQSYIRVQKVDCRACKVANLARLATVLHPAGDTPPDRGSGSQRYPLSNFLFLFFFAPPYLFFAHFCHLFALPTAADTSLA